MAKIIRLSALAEGWKDLDAEDRGDVVATNQVVRMASMIEALIDAGVERQEAVDRAAAWLCELPTNADRPAILQDLELVSLGRVHALDVALKILDRRPELVEGLLRGAFIQNIDALRSGEARARRPFPVRIPRAFNVKVCAALDGARPGFAFFPSVDRGEYMLQVASPGTWRFAILAASGIELGQLRRETQTAVVEEFTFVVAKGDEGFFF